jgi:hypothetical protein
MKMVLSYGLERNNHEFSSDPCDPNLLTNYEFIDGVFFESTLMTYSVLNPRDVLDATVPMSQQFRKRVVKSTCSSDRIEAYRSDLP